MKHTCNICGASFNRRYRLIEHINAHFGAKPYECGLCKIVFGRKGDLKVHENEKHFLGARFQCLSYYSADGLLHGCGKTFDRQMGLDRHLRRKGADACKQSSDKNSVVLARSLMNDPLSMKLSGNEIAQFLRRKGFSCILQGYPKVDRYFWDPEHYKLNRDVLVLSRAYNDIIQVARPAAGLGDWALLVSCILVLAIIDCHLWNLQAARKLFHMTRKAVEGFMYSGDSTIRSARALHNFCFCRSFANRRHQAGIYYTDYAINFTSGAEHLNDFWIPSTPYEFLKDLADSEKDKCASWQNCTSAPLDAQDSGSPNFEIVETIRLVDEIRIIWLDILLASKMFTYQTGIEVGASHLKSTAASFYSHELEWMTC